MNTESPPHKETWKTIEEFPCYEISDQGRVRNIITQKIKKPSPSKRGYPVMSFQKDGKLYIRTVHTVLARAFIPNPENKPQINHLDGDKWNYALSNLEWCTASENNRHARLIGLHHSDGDKPVLQYTIDGVFIKRYKSVSEASRQTGIRRCNIQSSIVHRRGQRRAGGYIWKYEHNTTQ